jgi:hypothetical protein
MANKLIVHAQQAQFCDETNRTTTLVTVVRQNEGQQWGGTWTRFAAKAAVRVGQSNLKTSKSDVATILEISLWGYINFTE